MSEADTYILQVENWTQGEPRYDEHLFIDRSFCLNALLNAEPSNANSAYGKKLVMNRLMNEPGDTLQCSIDGCEVTVLKEDLDQRDGKCALENFCLKAAWKASGKKDLKSQELWESTTNAAQRLRSSYSAGYKCPNPTCQFSCGWSVDGVPGTDGHCIKED